ncbi:hypothetical protein KFL_000360220 [Klebsormidium nitens]|uniref:START domain-containing protein n=1 Tax=Klebsormidium nitens TaxID=105231 RepID=A0A1Y1HT25_KLENI|nr:hypothetical protein KFL_000360220 [Klebsormidium nitens]|eukprot:GAQ79706.1 hypothetical protein KFL_000360220 [Klebsormidium nitens]
MDRTSARARLEEALSSADLCSKDSVRRLVNKAFLHSPDGEQLGSDGGVLNSRFEEVWRFLSELRGVSGELAKESAVVDDIDGRGWKVKEDTGNMRVLYRKGPEGTPLHTLCLEGMINGPLATALCVAWEAPYFKDWWPQFTVPTFKISESKWLEQPKPGQVIASVRFKVPWPFTAREIVLEAYAVDYLIQDVLIVLMKTLPPGPSPLSEDGPPIPPEDKGITRMEVVGGYIFQQIAPSQCYFRTIADIDLKLALVPAWVINFISRQLAGLGLKLFEKVVQDVTSAKDTKFVKVFQRLLETDPFLQQVKGGLAAPKSDGRSAAGFHRTVEGASEMVVSSNHGNASGRSAEVSEAEVRVEEHTRRGTVTEVRSDETAGANAFLSSQVGVRSRTENRESGVARENGQDRLEGYVDKKTELGASSDARESVSTSADGGRKKGSVPSFDKYKHAQANGSIRRNDYAPARERPSVSEQVSTSGEVHHCVQVIDRAIEFFKARKSEAAHKLDRHRDEGGLRKVESRDQRRGGEKPALNDVTDPNAGLWDRMGPANEVHKANGTLDRALNLMRTPAN